MFAYIHEFIREDKGWWERGLKFCLASLCVKLDKSIRILCKTYISTEFQNNLNCHTSSMFDPLSLSSLSESIRAALFFLFDIFVTEIMKVYYKNKMER